jgi:hypothetical protein
MNNDISKKLLSSDDLSQNDIRNMIYDLDKHSDKLLRLKKKYESAAEKCKVSDSITSNRSLQAILDLKNNALTATNIGMIKSIKDKSSLQPGIGKDFVLKRDIR